MNYFNETLLIIQLEAHFQLAINARLTIKLNLIVNQLIFFFLNYNFFLKKITAKLQILS